MVLAILEAAETLLEQGFQPKRTFYFAFGQDEEIGGLDGAAKLAETLKARGIRDAAFILDEGLPITTGIFPGVEGVIALIGTAEKGNLSLELKVEGEGGHSSMPPESTNIGILAKSISRLEENLFPLRMTKPLEDQFRFLGPEMPLKQRLVLANLWLFKPILINNMKASPQTAAMLRTTTAATIFQAGIKENVLPINATASVNFRILQGETVASTIQSVREVIDDDRIQIKEMPDFVDPSPVSDPYSKEFRVIDKTIRQIWGFPDLIVAPNLVIGGSDSKHFMELSKNIFRFTALKIESIADANRWHGTNERVPIKEYGNSIGFFQQLIRNTEEM